ncbi:MAG: type II toxin-antitoxin system Phd/YefM family antitoxin [Thermoflexaceae bacterium]|nr:type II toxin-antitoxin system Phd/YefM family antitoxin [Thermoflexaceae bacterium]
MKTASITEAKNRLSALLDQVKAGETIVITDRGVPVARLVSAAGEPGDDSGRLARLERKGGISRPKLLPVGPDELRAVIRGDSPAGGVEVLIQERRTGR